MKKSNVLRKMVSFLLVAVLAAGLGLFAPAYAADGDVAWKHNFGGTGNDQFNAVTAVSDGIVAVGWSDIRGTGDWEGVTPERGRDAIIVKYDNSSNVLWKHNFGGIGADYFTGVTVAVDGVVAVGYSHPVSFGNGDWAGVSGKGGSDAIIVKYNHYGEVVWKKNFGGSGDDVFNAVTMVSDGVVAVGYSQSMSFGYGDWTGVPTKGSEDAIIVKYDNSGNVVWKKNFGGNAYEYFTGVTAVSDGVVAVGYSYVDSFGNGDWVGVSGKSDKYDAIIVKYDNSGNVVWKKNFGGGNYNWYYGVTAVSDGFVAVGFSDIFGIGDWEGVTGKGGSDGSLDAIIVKYDNSGNVVWKKNFGGNAYDYFTGVTTVSDGVVAVGYSFFSTHFGTGDWEGVIGYGKEDAIIVKYDDSGNVVWKKNFGGGGYEWYTGVTAVSDGFVAVGHSDVFGTGDWEGVPGKGGLDAIIVKYDFAPPLTLTVYGPTTCPDQIISATFYIEGNFSVKGLTLDLAYDNTVLEYIELDDSWILGNIGTVTVSENTTDRIRMVWLASDDNMLTGSGDLYFINFRVKPDAPLGENPLTLTGIVTDQYGNAIPARMISGTVNVVGYTLGDVNNDGVIDIRDAVWVQSIWLDNRIPTPEGGRAYTMAEYMAADVNKDGRVDANDVVLILKHIADPDLWPLK